MEQVRIVRQTLLNRDWNEKIKKVARGFMIESYLADGRQNQPEIFGRSITDPCLGWENTVALVEEIYSTLIIFMILSFQPLLSHRKGDKNHKS